MTWCSNYVMVNLHWIDHATIVIRTITAGLQTSQQTDNIEGSFAFY